MPPKSIIRFLSKILLHNDWECWEWTAYKNQDGYPRFHFCGRDYYAHRASYELFVGPIPEGMTIDHLCGNTVCVNPTHLEPVTREENLYRRWRSYHAALEREEYVSEPHEYEHSFGSF